MFSLLHSALVSVSDTSSGTSRDWAAGAARIPFVYTAELRDTGAYGFVLPPAQIRPVGEETWAGAAALARFIQCVERQGGEATGCSRRGV